MLYITSLIISDEITIRIYFETSITADIISFPIVSLLLLVTRNVVQSDLFLRESINGIGFPLDNGTVAMMLELVCSNS